MPKHNCASFHVFLSRAELWNRKPHRAGFAHNGGQLFSRVLV